MPVVTLCASSDDFLDCIPAGYSCIDIRSITPSDVTNKYVQAKVRTKYPLSTYKRSSIKLILENDAGMDVDLMIFGPIANEVDSNCSVGDSLVLPDFEVDINPRRKANFRYYILVDDTPTCEPLILVIEASQDGVPTPVRPPPRQNTASSLAATTPAMTVVPRKGVSTSRTWTSPRQGVSTSRTSPTPSTSRQGVSTSRTSPTPSTSRQGVSTSRTSPRQGVNTGRTSATPSKSRQGVTHTNVTPTQTPAGTPSKKASRKTPTKATPHYTYTLLKDLTPGTTAHVYGVVSHFKPATNTSGSDFFMVLNLVDPSLSKDERLSCNFFNDEKDKLPTKAAIGDVIRVHRLKIQTFNGRNQARNGPGCHWLLFQGCYDNRVASSGTYTLDLSDEDKVSELLAWWRDLQGDPNDVDLTELTPMRPLPEVFQTLSEVNQVEEFSSVNVYALVTYNRNVMRTVRGEFHLMMNLCDATLGSKDEKLTLNLFDPYKDKLPCQARGGDVIRIHDLQIIIYQGKRQGVKGPHFRWVLFQNTFDQHLASTTDFVLKEEDRTKVESIWEWWLACPNNTPFSQVVSRQYFNVVCQVVMILQPEGNELRQMKVWDGTKFNGPILKCNEDIVDEDNQLAQIATKLDLIHDVFVFDDHVPSIQDIQPGDYISLTNLHAALVGGQIEMTLHGGRSYNRGVTRLSDGHWAVLQLKAILEPLINNQNINGSNCVLGTKMDGDAGPSTLTSTSHHGGEASTSRKDAENSLDKSPADTTSSSRAGKRSSDSTSELESPTKKRDIAERSDKTRNASSSSLSPSSASVINTTATQFPGSIKRKPFLQDFYHSPSSYTATQDNDDSITLPSSLKSPPSSMELTQRDRYFVEGILDHLNKGDKSDVSPQNPARESDNSNNNNSLLSINGKQDMRINVDGSEATGNKKDTQVVLPGVSMTSAVPLSSSLDRSVSTDHPLVSKVSSIPPSTSKDGSVSKENPVPTCNENELMVGDQTPAVGVDVVCSGETKSKYREKGRELQPTTQADSIVGTRNQTALLLSSQESFHTAEDPTSPRLEVVEGPNARSRKLTSRARDNSRTSPRRSERCRQKVTESESGSSQDDNKGKTPDWPDRLRQRRQRDGRRKGKLTRNSDAIDKISRRLDPTRNECLTKTTVTETGSSRNRLIREEERLPSTVTGLDNVVVDETGSLSSSQESYHTATGDTNQTSPIVGRRKMRSSPISLHQSTNLQYSKSFLSDLHPSTAHQPTLSQTDTGNVARPHSQSSSISQHVPSSPPSPVSQHQLPGEGRKEDTLVTVSKRNLLEAHRKLKVFVKHRRPTKLKAVVRLSQYSPDTDNLSSLVQMCCLKCKYMESASNIQSTECPNRCGKLEANIALKMWLSDGEYEVKAILLGQEAVDFFQGVRPQDLLHKPSSRKKVRKLLERIYCPPETKFESKPLMECCIFSYVVKNEMCFQIFDTVIV